MDALEACAGAVRVCLGAVRLRRGLLAWALSGAALGGSLLKALGPLPRSYLSDSGNLLNRYFVKVAWGWTFWLLLPFIALTNYQLTGSRWAVLRRLSSLLVGTAIWYVCTNVFSQVEHLTGGCYQSAVPDEAARKEPGASKEQCHGGGGFWHGFDISGHSFLLSFCTLVIVEEMAVLPEVKTDRGQGLHVALSVLVVALGFLALVWVGMFLCTAIYFHDLSQKVLGTLFGLLGWYATYGYWYRRPFSPGLPPRQPGSGPKQDGFKE
ncbi:fat storage-inducing transmembrane protein 2 [Tachyglossus aculeatus]|uniref:fat storage-inducing transmembrane protein 2 n=1 Tax=Tachyglossus aculeatus TaxID=9261 RepID=UPI0018F6CF1F|nr:fat storage-inducing transmembrane protein 2 [Tachyglossus aculeatus]